MKKNNATKIIFFVFLAAMLALAIFMQKPSLTGFFSMQEKKENPAQEESAKESVSAKISFEIIKPAKLEITVLKTEAMQCPQYFSLVFEAINSGDSVAEGFVAEPSHNLKVLDCLNCNVKQIKPKEKITVKLKACKVSGEAAYVSFRSINSEEKRIGI